MLLTTQLTTHVVLWLNIQQTNKHMYDMVVVAGCKCLTNNRYKQVLWELLELIVIIWTRINIGMDMYEYVHLKEQGKTE